MNSNRAARDELEQLPAEVVAGLIHGEIRIMIPAQGFAPYLSSALMNLLRRLHLILGALGVVAFLLTGQYMHWALDHLQGMAAGPRLLYRTAHIYLLWSSLANLLLGCYLQPLHQRLARAAQCLGGLSILAGPCLLLVSFFLESNHQDLARPITRMAIYLALAGAALHALGALVSAGHGRQAGIHP